MIERELKDISEDVLKELIAEGAGEGKTLEFKRALDVDNPEPKLKFLRGVASFANASGGDMVFGVVANKEGKAEDVIPLANFNPDRDTLRLRDIIRMNIEPRSVFVEFKPVELSAGGHALVIRIRKSWAGAHWVTFRDDFHFWTRDHGGKRRMEHSEIRGSMTLADTVVDRVNRFREERVANILADETVEPLARVSRVVLQVCPLRSFEPGYRCNLAPLWEDRQSGSVMLRPIYASGWDHRHDLEGYYAFTPLRDRGSSTGYSLAFFSGCYEAVDCELLNNEKALYAGVIESKLLEALPSACDVLRLIGAEPPGVAFVSLLNVRNFTLETRQRLSGSYYFGHPVRKDNLLFPGVLLESFDLPPSKGPQPWNALEAMRPIFDGIWNACGFPRSPTFDPS